MLLSGALAESYLQPTADDERDKGLFKAEEVLDNGWYQFKVGAKLQQIRAHGHLLPVEIVQSFEGTKQAAGFTRQTHLWEHELML